jgi:uncharacterized protein YdaT
MAGEFDFGFGGDSNPFGTNWFTGTDPFDWLTTTNDTPPQDDPVADMIDTNWNDFATDFQADISAPRDYFTQAAGGDVSLADLKESGLTIQELLTLGYTPDEIQASKLWPDSALIDAVDKFIAAPPSGTSIWDTITKTLGAVGDPLKKFANSLTSAEIKGLTGSAGTLLGSYLGNKAYIEGTDKSLALQKEMYDKTQANLKPFADMGQPAIDMYMDLAYDQPRMLADTAAPTYNANLNQQALNLEPSPQFQTALPMWNLNGMNSSAAQQFLKLPDSPEFNNQLGLQDINLQKNAGQQQLRLDSSPKFNTNMRLNDLNLNLDANQQGLNLGSGPAFRTDANLMTNAGQRALSSSNLPQLQTNLGLQGLELGTDAGQVGLNLDETAPNFQLNAGTSEFNYDPNSYFNSPVYKALMKSAQQAEQAAAAGKGYVGSGNQLAELQNLGMQVGAQYMAQDYSQALQQNQANNSRRMNEAQLKNQYLQMGYSDIQAAKMANQQANNQAALTNATFANNAKMSMNQVANQNALNQGQFGNQALQQMFSNTGDVINSQNAANLQNANFYNTAQQYATELYNKYLQQGYSNDIAAQMANQQANNAASLQNVNTYNAGATAMNQSANQNRQLQTELYNKYLQQGYSNDTAATMAMNTANNAANLQNLNTYNQGVSTEAQFNNANKQAQVALYNSLLQQGYSNDVAANIAMNTANNQARLTNVTFENTALKDIVNQNNQNAVQQATFANTWGQQGYQNSTEAQKAMLASQNAANAANTTYANQIADQNYRNQYQANMDQYNAYTQNRQLSMAPFQNMMAMAQNAASGQGSANTALSLLGTNALMAQGTANSNALTTQLGAGGDALYSMLPAGTAGNNKQF